MGKTFLYTEIQAAVPFEQFDWRQVNEALKTAPGLIRKTWLSGIGTHTVGGFYEFDSAENALAFAQMGVKGSQVQILSSRPCFEQVGGRSLTHGRTAFSVPGVLVVAVWSHARFWAGAPWC
ncbi:YdhR family protein [Streptomyces sp. NBC_00272]|uniref:YdhR family protein n=1 Tax=Streptomyces sp. NBC_00272 TaxID=2975698 RepID=UPI002E2AA91E|nr:YdhR family protein [Streptomyces sp. NBC_00272]